MNGPRRIMSATARQIAGVQAQADAYSAQISALHDAIVRTKEPEARGQLKHFRRELLKQWHSLDQQVRELRANPKGQK